MRVLFLITNIGFKKDAPYVGCGWVDSLINKVVQIDLVEVGVSFFSEEVRKLTKFDDKITPVQYVIPSYVNKWDKVCRNLKLTDYLFEERKALVLDVIKQFQPDLIHVFGTETPFGLLAKDINIPVLIHVQGILNPYVVKWFPAGYGVRDLIRSTSFIKLAFLSGYLGDYFRYLNLARREKSIFMMVEHYTGRTDWDRRLVRMMSGSSNYYHCDEVLRPLFYERLWAKKEPTDVYEIISVVNPNTYKGIETIIETVVLLQSFTRKKIVWTVAGVSPKSDVLKMFLRKSGVVLSNLNIKFEGPVPETLLIEMLVRSDLFVHPSHIDNSPNSVCEAMLIGMPIISTNVGGIQSLLTNEVEGILVQDGEPYGMASAVFHLMEEPEKARTLGNAARRRAIVRHNPDKIAERTFEIYREVLSRHRQS